MNEMEKQVNAAARLFDRVEQLWKELEEDDQVQQ
jgi:hypothetical protein